MRCLACGAEMRVVEVVADDTMMVPGYEHHTLQCMGCDEVERRLVFSREGTSRPAKPAPPRRPPVASTAPPAEPPLAAPPVSTSPADEPVRSAAEPISCVVAPAPSAAPPAEPVPSLTTPPAAAPTPAEPASLLTAPSAAVPAAASPPAEPAPAATTQPGSATSATDHNLDAGEALLKHQVS